MPGSSSREKIPRKSKAPCEPLLPRGREIRPGHSIIVRTTSWSELQLHTTYVPRSHEDSHFRQSLNPAVPALPVGASPRFRAVACVCVVTSPNEACTCCKEELYRLPALKKCLLTLIQTAPNFVKKKGKYAPDEAISVPGGHLFSPSIVRYFIRPIAYLMPFSSISWYHLLFQTASSWPSTVTKTLPLPSWRVQASGQP